MALTYQNMGRTFHECIFRNGWMDCRDVFYAVLCQYCYVMDTLIIYRYNIVQIHPCRVHTSLVILTFLSSQSFPTLLLYDMRLNFDIFSINCRKGKFF